MKHASPYWTHRMKRQVILAAFAVAATALIYLATAPPDFRHRFSMATAYSSLLFLGATLLLGPWNIFRRCPNPVSFDLRRDIGIWAGLLAILHTAVGLTVHLRGRMWMYFLKQRHPLKLQTGLFGSSNDIGLISALLFLMLLAISNDISLRTLGLRRWSPFSDGRTPQLVWPSFTVSCSRWSKNVTCPGCWSSPLYPFSSSPFS
ncbi:MAG: hypothetical protein ABI158_05245 [Edaphobacter sp.]